ncbi:MAG TPA: chorismate mutase [Clostridiales bacterium]|nr:chorismate mutase [Clostridiales bacterium]
MTVDIKALRLEIDRIDAELIRLFELRMQTVRKVGEYKQTHKMPVLDISREEEVIRNRVRCLSDATLADPLKKFFQNLMHLSRQLQQSETQAFPRKIERIVLIGMPTSGKSTLGKRLARIAGMGFLDTDALIESLAGTKIPEIFRTRGEQEFRSLESSVVRAVSTASRCVIATGGGVVLSKENMAKLKTPESRIVWIHRPMEAMIRALDGDSRPLALTAEALKKLNRERLPLYRQYQDVEVENTGDPDEVAKKIILAIGMAV